MQDQATGSARMSAAEPSQQAMEQAIVSALLADGSEPVWSRGELEAHFPNSPLVFADAFSELESAGVLCVCGEMVKVARAVRYVDELEGL